MKCPCCQQEVPGEEFLSIGSSKTLLQQMTEREKLFAGFQLYPKNDLQGAETPAILPQAATERTVK